MHYVGMDCHITTLDFAVVNDAGRLVKSCKVDTSAKNFMEFVKSVAAPRIVYMEESALAAWALETCIRFGEKLVITDPKQNHWIGSSTQKDDPLDAFKLAQLGRGGFIKEIRHPVGDRRRFRELMDCYHDTVKSTTRIKNKIKSKFRQNGIHCTGMTVYSETYREEWRQKLPQDQTLLLIVEGLWNQLKESEQTEKNLLKAARNFAKHYPEIKLFEDIPGIGFISAATISAILETPLTAIIKGLDEMWDVALIKFIFEMTQRSVDHNARQMNARGLLTMDAQGIPADARARIEELFLNAAAGDMDPGILKDELDRWNIFPEYEDRFLSLFRK